MTSPSPQPEGQAGRRRLDTERVSSVVQFLRRMSHGSGLVGKTVLQRFWVAFGLSVKSVPSPYNNITPQHRVLQVSPPDGERWANVNIVCWETEGTPREKCWCESRSVSLMFVSDVIFEKPSKIKMLVLGLFLDQSGKKIQGRDGGGTGVFLAGCRMRRVPDKTNRSTYGRDAD